VPSNIICSFTIRTARAGTSDENLFVVLLVVDPACHELGSPTNPARFSALSAAVQWEDSGDVDALLGNAGGDESGGDFMRAVSRLKSIH
jgi:hypothetical protein